MSSRTLQLTGVHFPRFSCQKDRVFSEVLLPVSAAQFCIGVSPGSKLDDKGGNKTAKFTVIIDHSISLSFGDIVQFGSSYEFFTLPMQLPFNLFRVFSCNNGREELKQAYFILAKSVTFGLKKPPKPSIIHLGDASKPRYIDLLYSFSSDGVLHCMDISQLFNKLLLTKLRQHFHIYTLIYFCECDCRANFQLGSSSSKDTYIHLHEDENAHFSTTMFDYELKNICHLIGEKKVLILIYIAFYNG